MRLRSLARYLSPLAVTMCLSPLALAAKPSTVTFFGDSLSDTGNGDVLASLYGYPDQTPSPPYAPGVVSNGPVWANFFAAAVGRPDDASPALRSPGGRNFAIATARTGPAGIAGLGLGMLSQLTVHDNRALAIDANGLYSLFGGSTDIFDAAALGDAGAREQTVRTAVGNLSSLASTLYQRGARNFLIPNLPDLGDTPAGHAAHGPQLTELSDRFNVLLAAEIDRLRGTLPGSTFYDLSLDVLQDNVLFDSKNGAARYGITNVTLPCFSGGASCDVSAFVDDRHPSSAMHRLIGAAAHDLVVGGLDVTPVPEPEPAVLVLCGLGMIGWMVRRNRARQGRERSSYA